MLIRMVATKITTLYLTRLQRKRLKELARATHTSMAALIREAIDKVYPQPTEAAK